MTWCLYSERAWLLLFPSAPALSAGEVFSSKAAMKYRCRGPGESRVSSVYNKVAINGGGEHQPYHGRVIGHEGITALTCYESNSAVHRGSCPQRILRGICGAHPPSCWVGLNFRVFLYSLRQSEYANTFAREIFA